MRDEYKAYDSVIDAVPDRIAAGCLAHARRKFDELLLDGAAKLHGHEPWTYLSDVIARLPTQLNSRIDELLPHNWKPRP